MTVECPDCGRTFEKEDYRDVHMCAAVFGEKPARAHRAFHDTAQRFLDEDY